MYQTFMPQQYQPYQPFQQLRQDVFPQQSIVQQQSGGFTIRPVASRAEAEATQIPFDGSTHFFYDTSNGKLYAKTFNAMNGTAPLVIFSRETEVQIPPQYVTMEEFNSLKEEIEKMKKPVGKAMKKDDAE